MFYPCNDNYMQDLYFYNQTPNNMNTYNPNMNGMQNTNMMGNTSGMYMGQNSNFFNGGMNQSQNINNLYPSIYRIITPVISRVIANSNYQFLNEDVLNNMVDTVYNIVEGQIDYNDDDNSTNTRTSAQTDTTSNSSSNTTNNSSTTATRTTDSRQTTQTTTTSRNNRNDDLLRDIIKILILKELVSRSQMQNGGQFGQNPYYQGTNYNMNF